VLAGNHDKEARKLTEEFSWLNNLAEISIHGQPIVSVTMPCGSGIGHITDRGIFTGIHMGDCRNRPLHYRWTSVSTRTTSVRVPMTKSVD
jgi:hypothetical protein